MDVGRETKECFVFANLLAEFVRNLALRGKDWWKQTTGE